ERSSEKQEQEADGSQMGKARVSLLVLVSAKIVDPQSDSPQRGTPGDETTLSGALSEEIDELRWRMNSACGDQMDVLIIRGVSLRFSLEGILDGPIDAIRAFYTSPMDAMLLGNLLLKKS